MDAAIEEAKVPVIELESPTMPPHPEHSGDLQESASTNHSPTSVTVSG